jgi:hypothetical protein
MIGVGEGSKELREKHTQQHNRTRRKTNDEPPRFKKP